MRAGWDVLRIHGEGLFTRPTSIVREAREALARAEIPQKHPTTAV